MGMKPADSELSHCDTLNLDEKHRVLTRILKIGVKCCLPENIGVLLYFSIDTFEKVGVRIKKLE